MLLSNVFSSTKLLKQRENNMNKLIRLVVCQKYKSESDFDAAISASNISWQRIRNFESK